MNSVPRDIHPLKLETEKDTYKIHSDNMNDYKINCTTPSQIR